jgi:hypothetical protein
VDGYLTSTDWTTFNGKQAAYTLLTTFGSLANATGFLKNNGSGVLSYDNTPQNTALWGSITGASAQAAPAGGWTGNHGAFAVGALTATQATITGGGFAAGTIYKSGVLGLVVAGATGSGNDFTVVSPGGSNILGAFTGTTNTWFNGSISILGGGFAAGTIYKSGVLGLVVAGATGSANDLCFVTPGGSNIFGVYTGTVNCWFNGSVSMGALGTNGKTPQTSASVNAACTDLATAIALINQLRAALIANGICV